MKRVPLKPKTGMATRARLCAGVSFALVLGACATPKPPPRVDHSYVMLLDNGDGTTGKVHITGPSGGLTVLDTAQTATLIAGPVDNRYPVDDAMMRADFAAAVAASPRRPVTYRLYFETGGSRLTAASRAELPRILDELVRRSAPDISVVGHTDTTGESNSNLALGLLRARSVVDVLGAQSQIPADRIFIESHGERNLLVNTPDNTEEPRNRRVEVTVR